MTILNRFSFILKQTGDTYKWGKTLKYMFLLFIETNKEMTLNFIGQFQLKHKSNKLSF